MKKVAVSIHSTENFSPNIIKGFESLDYIHVDVLDGKFLETKAYYSEVFKILK